MSAEGAAAFRASRPRPALHLDPLPAGPEVYRLVSRFVAGISRFVAGSRPARAA